MTIPNDGADASIVADSEQMLTRAEALVIELQQGNQQKVEQILDYITSIRDGGLFREVGKVTRQIHDSLQSFRNDDRLNALAEADIPDAQQRLRYVIDMTQKAADRTLNAVEVSMPHCERLGATAGELQQSWQKFTERKMSAEEFRELSRQITQFLADSRQSSGLVKDNLNEVLLAQDFQDLTGQIIKRVITLVEEVEARLVDLVRITGSKMQATGQVAQRPEDQDAIKAEGPSVPGVDDTKRVCNQDDVDDLLSSLGF